MSIYRHLKIYALRINAAIFVMLSISFTLVVEAENGPMQTPMHWTRLPTPGVVQTSQIEAGYPMGCEITALVYALKIGPQLWRSAYDAIPGTDDIQKIRSLATKFKGLKSRDSESEPAFSEEYGTSPNDMPWMFQALVPTEKSMRSLELVRLPKLRSMPQSLLQLFQSKITTRLETGKPIIAQLYYSNPDFSHAVVITGVGNSLTRDGEIQISIIDPMTGKESIGNLKSEQLMLAGNKVLGLSFQNFEIVSRKGILMSVLL